MAKAILAMRSEPFAELATLKAKGDVLMAFFFLWLEDRTAGCGIPRAALNCSGPDRISKATVWSPTGWNRYVRDTHQDWQRTPACGKSGNRRARRTYSYIVALQWVLILGKYAVRKSLRYPGNHFPT